MADAKKTSQVYSMVVYDESETVGDNTVHRKIEAIKMEDGNWMFEAYTTVRGKDGAKLSENTFVIEMSRESLEDFGKRIYENL